MFKAFILFAAIVVAAVSAPSLEPFFQSLKTSLVDKLALHVGSTSAITQSTAEVGTLTPADQVTPPINETASTPTEQSMAQPEQDALFEQFRAWAAAQTNAAPVGTVPDVPAKVMQDAPKRLAEKPRAPIPLVQKQRAVVHNARPEPGTRSPRKPLLPMQNAQAQVQPAQSVRVREQAAENAVVNAAPEAQWATQRSQ